MYPINLKLYKICIDTMCIFEVLKLALFCLLWISKKITLGGPQFREICHIIKEESIRINCKLSYLIQKVGQILQKSI